MIEGISGVISRINEIHSRIDAISSIGKYKDLAAIGEKALDSKETSTDPNQKKFSEILKQVLEENGTLPGLEDNPELAAGRLNKLIGSSSENKALLEMLYKSIGKTGNKSDINEVISEAAEKYNLDKSLIKAVIEQESGFETGATSPKGAMGLMQLMPETAQALGVENPYDVRENIMGGSRYLKMLMNKFNNNLDLSLAAYNAGPKAVENYKGIPPYDETQNYVKKVLQYYNEFKNFE